MSPGGEKLLVRPSLIVVSIAFVVAGLACFPEPLDVTGKRCLDEQSCGPDHLCQASLCVPRGSDADGGVADGGEDPTDAGEPDAGPPGPLVNLLVNPGFESEIDSDGGSPEGWSTLPSLYSYAFSTSTEAHSGEHSAKVFVVSSSTVTLKPSPAPVPDSGAGTGIYCARAWVLGEDYQARLELLEGPAQAPQSTKSVPAIADGGWQELRVVRQVAANQPVSLGIVAQVATGFDLYVDDVQLWRSASLECKEQ